MQCRDHRPSAHFPHLSVSGNQSGAHDKLQYLGQDSLQDVTDQALYSKTGTMLCTPERCKIIVTPLIEK